MSKRLLFTLPDRQRCFYHPQVLALAFLWMTVLVSSASAQYTPTISGVNAFWYLGQGILANGGNAADRLVRATTLNHS